MYKNYLTKISFVVLVTLISFSACKKEEIAASGGYLPSVHFADSTTIVYGNKLNLNLPAEYSSLKGVTFTLDFKGNKNLKVNSTDSLNSFLAKGITIATDQRSVLVNAAELYPNETYSELSGQRLPKVYVVTLNASSSAGFKPVKTTFKIRVIPAALGIQEISSADLIPYGYHLYQETPVNYTVDTKSLITTGTVLVLHQNGYPDGHITLSGKSIVLDKNAGDPLKKAEWTYDLVPALTRDGYDIAYKQFRIVIMNKPKFFFGTYYADYDLTILQNRVVIGLGNAFTSAAPTFSPLKYAGSFKLKRLTKDGVSFADPTGVFSVDKASGKVSVLANTVLSAGTYKFVIEATATTGLVLEAELNLVME